MFTLYYYYSQNCQSCKDYQSTVDKIARELKLDAIYIDIDVGNIIHHIVGIPTICIDKDARTIYKSIGNLPYENIIDDIRKEITNDE